MKANNIQELFGTIQQSVITSWRKHLKTSSHSEHVILNDFYDDMLDAVDALIEGYMAHNDKVEGYKNILDHTKDLSAVEYLTELYDICKNGKSLLGEEEEVVALMDDVLDVINSALYKLKNLVKESIDPKGRNLTEYLSETFLNEAYKYMRYDLEVRHPNEKYGKLVAVVDNFSDRRFNMFVMEDGVIAGLDSAALSEIKPLLTGLNISGSLVSTDRVGNTKPDHAMDCGDAGKRLYKKLESGKRYRVSTGDNPHGKVMKLHKV